MMFGKHVQGAGMFGEYGQEARMLRGHEHGVRTLSENEQDTVSMGTRAGMLSEY